MPNASTRFLDRAIRHSIYLQRLSSHEVNEILKFLNKEVYPDLVSKIEREVARVAARGPTASTYQLRRMQALMQSLRGTIETGYRDAYGRLRSRLNDIALTEAEWVRAVVRDIMPISVDLITPSPPTLRTIVTQRPYLGKLTRDWWDDMGTSLRKGVQTQLNIGLAQGDSVGDIVRRIRGTRTLNYTDGLLQQSRRQVETNVRTSIRHVSAQTRQMVYEENSDIIRRVQWVSVLDARTTDICMSLDGREFLYNEGPRPPMHHQCRSDVVPIFASWKELGLEDPPEATRAALDGEVPASMTYGDWLKTQPPKLQDEVLGRTRAQLFRDGKVPIDRFVDEKFRRLTLEELRIREGLSIDDIRVRRGSSGS